jgi:hypothetical protein
MGSRKLNCLLLSFWKKKKNTEYCKKEVKGYGTLPAFRKLRQEHVLFK